MSFYGRVKQAELSLKTNDITTNVTWGNLYVIDLFQLQGETSEESWFEIKENRDMILVK